MRAIIRTVLLSSLAGVFSLLGQTDCAQCHDQTQKLGKSTHAGLDCQTCHDGVNAYPHTAPVPKASCDTCHDSAVKEFEAGAHAALRHAGNAKAPTCASCHNDVHETRKAKDAAFRQDVPKVCGACHAAISQQYQASVHGALVLQGDQASASCTSCHGAHTNLPPRDPESLVNARNIRQTCASCHENVVLARRFHLPLDKVTTFDQSFHGLAAKTGTQTVANCASCHGIHNILPAADPKSTIHPANLKATCGHCHPGASERFANAKMHRTEKEGQPTAVLVIRIIYLILIPATITLMFLHQFGDFVRKSRLLRQPGVTFAAPSGELRMHGAERLIHGLMAMSFVVLVLTGFALRYPDAWWAEPMVQFEASWPVRGTLHRAAAIAILIAGIAHIASLIASPKLRDHWQSLAPRWTDVPQGWGTFLYNLGLRKTKPELPHHSYVAKVEYWAVVWGTAIMALTGFLLWANRYTFQWIPREWLDAAAALHFYEAVLATFAVLVWHFYTVIFDPEVYPLDPALFTGKSGRREIAASGEDRQSDPEPKA